MALAFLPANHITEKFNQLVMEANNELLNALCDYFRDTWITNAVWQPDVWSVYMMHNLLWDKGKTIELQVKLHCNNKLKRQQKRNIATTSAGYFNKYNI